MKSRLFKIILMLFPAVIFLLIYQNTIFKEGNQKPNIVIISIDTCRADHLGSYGNPLPVSPILDVLSRKGTVFANATTQGSYTLPAHHSLFTGLYPIHHVCINMFYNLPVSETYLPEVLHQQGYQTAAFTGGGFLSKEFGFNRGFDIFQPVTNYLPETTQKAMEWIGKLDSDKPFFLFLHGYDTHIPYHSVDPYKSFISGRYPLKETNSQAIPVPVYEQGKDTLNYYLTHYDAALLQVDHILKKFFYFLKEEGKFENTIFVVLSDHGEELMDHGAFSHRWASLYQSNANVILFLWGPGIPTGKIIADPVQLTDVFPTLMDLLGISIPNKFDGKNLFCDHKPQDRYAVSNNINSLLLNMDIVAERFIQRKILLRIFRIFPKEKLKSHSVRDLIQKDFNFDVLPESKEFVMKTCYGSMKFLIKDEHTAYLAFFEFLEKTDHDFEESFWPGFTLRENERKPEVTSWKRFETKDVVYYLPESGIEYTDRLYNSSSIQLNGWKLIRDAGTHKIKLFNLEWDPGEQKNVAADFPELASELEKILLEKIKSDKSKITLPRNNLSESDMEKVGRELKALGYISE